MESSAESESIPLHREWWFRILVTLFFATLLQLWNKHNLGNDSKSGDSFDANVENSSPKTAHDGSSKRDERQERLRYSRLLAQGGTAHDLSLMEDDEPSRHSEKAKNIELDPVEVDQADPFSTIPEEQGALHSSQGMVPDNASVTTGETPRDSENGSAARTAKRPKGQSSEVPQPIDAAVTNQQRAIDRTLLLQDNHPGLDAFCYWWDVNTSLFRIYTVARTDGVDVSPPYNPTSRRGMVPISLKVANGTEHVLVVYWVDFKGKLVDRGKVTPGRTWLQTTWIDHPWVFCRADTDQPLLYYIPYRVIPTTKQEPTVDPDEPEVGVHRFTILPPPESSGSSSDRAGWACQVADPVLPYPASDFFLTPEIAVAWTLLHCHRMSFSMNIDWNILITYLSKIVQNPNEPKYRKIRLANPNFAPVWNSPLQGLLLAAGFVEHREYAYLGRQDAGLSRERVQEISQLLYHLEQWKDYHNTSESSGEVQPQGADGFGREGYGRAGLSL